MYEDYNVLHDDNEEFHWYILRGSYTVEPRKNGYKYNDTKFYMGYHMKEETT